MATRVSQTELAVLGALSVEPMTGYGVRAAIVGTLGHFWAESFGQIYPALDRLERAGLVEHTQARGPYRLTEPGRAHLVALLGTPVEGQPPRNGVLLRLFFGRNLGPEACIQLVTDAAERARETLDRLAAIRAADAQEPATPDSPYWAMTISAGEHSASATLAWAQETLDVLHAMADRGGR